MAHEEGGSTVCTDAIETAQRVEVDVASAPEKPPQGHGKSALVHPILTVMSPEIVAGSNLVATAVPIKAAANGDDEDAARRQRLAAFVEKWVPNEAVWPALLALSPPTDVFTRGEIPFGERTLLFSRHARGMGRGVFDSMLFPYVLTMFTAFGSIFVVHRALHDWYDSLERDVDAWLMLAAVVAQIIPCVSVVGFLTESPTHVFLYYRMWEQKVLVDFEPRPVLEIANIVPVVVAAAAVLAVGRDVFLHQSSFLFAVLQSFGTIWWVLQSNLSVEKHLVHIQSAVRGTARGEAENDGNGNGIGIGNDQASGSTRRLGALLAQMHVVPEAKIRGDAMALTQCHRDHRRRAAHAKRRRDACELACVEEEARWLQVCATWIGRLGHSSGARHVYAQIFLGNGALYDDAMWHAFGSFAAEPNATGSMHWLSVYCVLPFLVVLALFAFMFASMATRVLALLDK